MKKIHEENGYTIIIVLLIIVLFLSASAVFIKSSISHAKQEHVVDINNQAVDVAEMGVEYYQSSFTKSLETVFDHVILEIKDKKLLTELEKCDTEICRDNVRKNVVNMYVSKLNELNLDSPVEAIDSKKNGLKYLLESKTIIPDFVKKEINITLKVKGITNGKNEKLLTAFINIPFPEFFEINDTSQNVESVFELPSNLPKCIYNERSTKAYPCRLSAGESLITVKNSIPAILRSQVKIVVDDPESDLCQEGKNKKKSETCIPHELDGLSIYSESKEPMTVDFSNKFDGFSWYHKGTIQVESPMNKLSSETTFVFDNLVITSPFNNMSGRIVLMGNDLGKVMDSSKKIMIAESGKMCLNLSSYNKEQLDDFKGNFSYKSGEVYYYINPSIMNFSLHSSTHVIKSASVESFYRDCGIKVIESSGGINYNTFRFPDIQMDVDYSK